MPPRSGVHAGRTAEIESPLMSPPQATSYGHGLALMFCLLLGTTYQALRTYQLPRTTHQVPRTVWRSQTKAPGSWPGAVARQKRG